MIKLLEQLGSQLSQFASINSDTHKETITNFTITILSSIWLLQVIIVKLFKGLEEIRQHRIKNNVFEAFSKKLISQLSEEPIEGKKYPVERLNEKILLQIFSGMIHNNARSTSKDSAKAKKAL